MSNYKVSYIENNSIKHSKSFDSEQMARKWIKDKGSNITPLKLLIWSSLVDCYSTVEKFNNKGNATATTTIIIKSV